MKQLIVALSIIFVFFVATSASAEDILSPRVKIVDYQGNVQREFSVLGDAYQGNTHISTIDFGGDGINELLVSSGMDNKAVVEAWRGDGTQIYTLPAYGSDFRGGAYVTAGDIDGDKQDEIITGPEYRGTPHIRIFKDGKNIRNFFGFDKNSLSGANVLAADMGGDGISEIILGSSIGQKPGVAMYDASGRKIKSAMIDVGGEGTSLAKIDSNSDNKFEILAASAYGGMPEVLIMDQDFKVTHRFLAFDKDFKGGINVASGDVTGDGKPEIIVGSGYGKGEVRVFSLDGTMLYQFFPFGDAYTGGVVVAAGKYISSGATHIAAIPQRVYSKIRSSNKYIEVDLSKQTLYYWQSGYRLGRFLISSGKSPNVTPKGEFKIYNKRPNVRMTWYYGPGNPMNYDLPNVPWVSSFKGPYTIHGTYWHKNFGHPMSHGCVNMYTPDAKLIYDWAPIGTPVIIY